MKKNYYVAYGSNMNIDQMSYRCPNARVVGSGTVSGYRLRFRSVATIDKDASSDVPVVVWEITPSDEVALDVYEGYPRLYRKERVKVDLDGKELEAMVYVMNGNGGDSAPSNSYYKTILDGYLQNNINTQHLIRAEARSKRSWKANRYYRDLTDDLDDSGWYGSPSGSDDDYLGADMFIADANKYGLGEALRSSSELLSHSQLMTLCLELDARLFLASAGRDGDFYLQSKKYDAMIEVVLNRFRKDLY